MKLVWAAIDPQSAAAEPKDRTQGLHQWVFKSIAEGPLGEKNAFEFPILRQCSRGDSSGARLPGALCGAGAALVRRRADVLTMCAGLIRDPLHAEAIVGNGDADLVALGRGVLNDPRWAWHAAETLGVKTHVPHQYMRGETKDGLPSQDTIIRAA